MSEGFYSWLRRKYGLGKKQYEKIEQDDHVFAKSLIREYGSIAASYGACLDERRPT